MSDAEKHHNHIVKRQINQYHNEISDLKYIMNVPIQDLKVTYFKNIVQMKEELNEDPDFQFLCSNSMFSDFLGWRIARRRNRVFMIKIDRNVYVADFSIR